MDAGSFIRLCRYRLGKTQDAIAAELGVDANTWSRWETGLSVPQRDMVPQLARALGCQEAELEELCALVRGKRGAVRGQMSRNRRPCPVGEHYWWLVVEGEIRKPRGAKGYLERWWACRCACGAEKLVEAPRWYRRSPGNNNVCPKSCGCKTAELTQAASERHRGSWKVAVGDRFTRLIVVGLVPREMGKDPSVRVRCDCGTVLVAEQDSLLATTQQRTKSCGCLNRERAAEWAGSGLQQHRGKYVAAGIVLPPVPFVLGVCAWPACDSPTPGWTGHPGRRARYCSATCKNRMIRLRVRQRRELAAAQR